MIWGITHELLGYRVVRHLTNGGLGAKQLRVQGAIEQVKNDATFLYMKPTAEARVVIAQRLMSVTRLLKAVVSLSASVHPDCEVMPEFLTCPLGFLCSVELTRPTAQVQQILQAHR